MSKVFTLYREGYEGGFDKLQYPTYPTLDDVLSSLIELEQELKTRLKIYIYDLQTKTATPYAWEF